MADLVYGAEEDLVLWGEDVLAWGPGAVAHPDYIGVIRLSTLHMKEHGTTPRDVRIWTGPGELTHGGHTWLSHPPWLLGFNSIDQSKKLNDRDRVTVAIALSGEVESQVSSMGLGDQPKTDVTLRMVHSRDGGITWEWTPGTLVEGVMSAPRLSRPAGDAFRAFTFEVATLDADVDRGYTRYWDNKTQQQLYPGENDLFFEHVQKLEAGAFTLHFPGQLDDVPWRG